MSRSLRDGEVWYEVFCRAITALDVLRTTKSCGYRALEGLLLFSPLVTGDLPRNGKEGFQTITKGILSVVPACISPGAEQIKASWRALPIECVELSRKVSYGY